MSQVGDAIAVAAQGTSVMEALELVLRLPSVASKRFLTTKVDRSVTGLVAQQQCVGPLQVCLNNTEKAAPHLCDAQL